MGVSLEIDGQKFYYPGRGDRDVEGEDPNFPNTIRPERVGTIVGLRDDYHEKHIGITTKGLTPAETSAVLDKDVPLDERAAVKWLMTRENDSAIRHPLRFAVNRSPLRFITASSRV